MSDAAQNAALLKKTGRRGLDVMDKFDILGDERNPGQYIRMPRHFQIRPYRAKSRMCPWKTRERIEASILPAKMGGDGCRLLCVRDRIYHPLSQSSAQQFRSEGCRNALMAKEEVIVEVRSRRMR